MLCVLFICVFLWEKENTWESWGGFSFMLDMFFSHRAHGGHGGFKRTVSSPQNASGIQSAQSVSAKDGCKVLWYLYAGGLLWNAVCSVLLCKSVRKKRLRLAVGRFFFYAGYVFLSQSAQSSRSFLRTVSSPQNASGIQSSQSVIAKGGCWVLGIRCWGLAIDGWWVIVVRC